MHNITPTHCYFMQLAPISALTMQSSVSHQHVPTAPLPRGISCVNA
jgi:hypothetical protein